MTAALLMLLLAGWTLTAALRRTTTLAGVLCALLSMLLAEAALPFVFAVLAWLSWLVLHAFVGVIRHK